MTLQERLRFELSRIADEECYDGGSHQLMFLRQSEARELRDALDAKDARINELSRIAYLFVEADDAWKDGDITWAQYEARVKEWTQRAREALK